jgi:hypothetical protein
MIARCLVLCSFALCSLSAADPGLNRIESVYLLPMSSGLDQYLASRIAREGRFRVVTDPARAEAVLTDRLGTDFEERMTQLYPPPEPPKPEKKDDEQEKSKDDTIGSALSEAAGTAPPISSFSRSKGNVFLVDRNTRQVLWSFYLRPRSTTSDELHHVAGEIAKNLHEESKRLMKRTAATPPPATAPAPVAAPAPTAPPEPVSAKPAPPAVPPAK